MPKQIETSFVISGAINPQLSSDLTALAQQIDTLTQKISGTQGLVKALGEADIFEKKIINTASAMRTLTEGTAEYNRRAAASDRYIQRYGELSDTLKSAGVDMRHLNWETTRLNEELARSVDLRDSLQKKYEAERAEYNAWMTDSAKYRGTGQAEYNAAENENNARLQAEAQARINVIRSNVNEYLAQQARYEAQFRLNQTSFIGGLGGFSFMGLGMSALGGAMPAYVTGAAVRGIYDISKASLQEAMSFDKTISELMAYTSATAAETEILRRKALDIGLNTVFTAEETAKAMTYLGKAGWTSAQINSGIKGVMNLSAASGEDIASVASIVADTIGAFPNLSAGDTIHLADVLAKTATRSNTDVGLIGETFKTSAPVAGALGYRIEDVAQMIGILANVGIKGTRAGTASRNILNAIAKGFTISGSKLGDYVFSATDDKGKQKSLRDTLNELRDAFSQLTDIEKVQNAQQIASMRGYAGLLALVNASADEYERLAEEIENAEGAAQKMADTRLDNLAGDVTKLTSAFSALKIQIGEALTPAARGAVEIGTDFLRILAGESPEGANKEYVAALMKLWLNTNPQMFLTNLSNKAYIALMKKVYGGLFGIGDNGAAASGYDMDIAHASHPSPNKDNITAYMEDLEEEYETLYEAAKSSIEGQFALWEQAAEVIPKDIYELMDAQESQTAYWKEYTDNLDELYQRADEIPGFKDFLKANATGDANSVALIAGLAEATNAEIAEFMRLRNETVNAELNAEDAMTGNGITIIQNIDATGASETSAENIREAGAEIAELVANAVREMEVNRGRLTLIA